jgi:hypothetical protein
VIEIFCYVLALIWGGCWALCLQFTTWGRWLVARRTWLTVVIGIGVDGLILLPIMTLDVWLRMLVVVTLSAVGIVGRSLYNERREEASVIEEVKGKGGN